MRGGGRERRGVREYLCGTREHCSVYALFNTPLPVLCAESGLSSEFLDIPLT